MTGKWTIANVLLSLVLKVVLALLPATVEDQFHMPTEDKKALQSYKIEDHAFTMHQAGADRSR